MKNIAVLFLLFISISICRSQGNKVDLFTAIETNDTLLVAKMIKQGYDLNTIQQTGWVKINPLIHAVLKRKIRICEMLIANGSDINWQDGFQTTAIMYAASDGQEQIVKLLLDHDANVLIKDSLGNDALSAANESKNEKIINLVKVAQAKEKLK